MDRSFICWVKNKTRGSWYFKRFILNIIMNSIVIHATL